MIECGREAHCLYDCERNQRVLPGSEREWVCVNARAMDSGPNGNVAESSRGERRSGRKELQPPGKCGREPLISQIHKHS